MGRTTAIFGIVIFLGGVTGTTFCWLNLTKHINPDNARTGMQDSYRLKPDHRFLLAISELSRVLSNKPQQEATANFVNGKWIVQQDTHLVGTLPELADYKSSMDLLERWARDLIHRNNLMAVEGKPIPSEKLQAFMADKLIQSFWSVSLMPREFTIDKSAVQSLAQALSLITFQTTDDLQISDIIPARALATIALTKACNRNVDSEECLLMNVLGYDTESVKAAKCLPSKDPVAFYVLQKDDELRELAESQWSNVRAKYLYLSRLSLNSNAKNWFHWEDTQFSEKDGHELPIMELATQPVTDSDRSDLDRELVDTTVKQVERASINTDVQVRQTQGYINNLVNGVKNRPFSPNRPDALDSPEILDRFESALKAVPQNNLVSFLDKDLITAYYRSHFYSGLYLYGLCFLNSPSDIEHSKEFLSNLGSSNTPAAIQFRKWYQHAINTKEGKASLVDLRNDLSTFSIAPFLKYTFIEIYTLSPPMDPMIYITAHNLFSNLDSRPQNRHDLTNITCAELLWWSTEMFNQPTKKSF